ncbi:CDGSH iron-sulfur domain-containing protein 2 homolog [Watersipora subatra]|uniref:CDGSH iron-sulfur domain-containing protein 2 homolog n=1 Tax=Watersipora subatra TaxID=2589382 RepID=UPI00355BB4A6
MQFASGLVKDSLADYLKKLPIPDTFLGWFSLSFSDWLKLVPFMGAVGGISYVTYRQIRPTHTINPSVKKGQGKVVDTVDIEDMTADQVSYCRCWRSMKFPLCDGAHNLYNLRTGDNIGPLVVKKSS